LLVVDEDEPGGFQQYADSVGQTVPDTYTVRTGKGTHFYFTANGSSHGNSPGPLAQFGCDVRGDGGYVLAAGSTHPSGAVYHVASDCNVAPLPGWLADALDGNSGPFTDPTQPFELPDVIKAGERDQVLFRYACQLRAQGTKVVAAARLIRAVHGRCEQPAGTASPSRRRSPRSTRRGVTTPASPAPKRRGRHRAGRFGSPPPRRSNHGPSGGSGTLRCLSVRSP
jgi:hypothetical protein